MHPGRHLALLLPLILASCTSVPTVDPHRAVDEQIWTLVGKLSIRQDGDTRVASINWHQQGESTEISLSAALGLGRVSISGDNDVMTVNTGRETLELRRTEALYVDGSTYRLPWRELRWWVRGRTPEGVVLPETYQSGEWRVLTLEKDELGPRLMEFHHPLLSIRLRVQRWQFEAESQPVKVI